MIFLMVTKGTGDDQTLTAANAVQDLPPAVSLSLAIALAIHLALHPCVP